jgi:3-oxosteroid 1-dehydrogenase
MQEHVYDVVVLGTGAAGLTAALRAAADGARVGLFEKAVTVGGTSAWSGGTVWLPNNRHEVELGFSDSREEVLTYLMSLSHGLMEQPLVTYGGHGGTLGPGLVFGYLSGRHAAALATRP